MRQFADALTAQAGGVPIWVSGTTNKMVARRIATFGSGWIPWGDAQLWTAVGVLVVWMSVAFVLLRLAYIALYVADRHVLRSTVWSIGLLVSVLLVFSSHF